MAKVTLDVETFKALASPTRLQVLRALDERRKTLSELSKELELNKATIHEHLQLLVAVGLVKKRDDEGRKWIYYELTWQGERLLHPQDTTTFAVLLGLGVVAAGGGVAMLGKALGLWWQEQQAKGLDEGALPEAEEAPEGQEQMAASEPSEGDTAEAPADAPGSARAPESAAEDAPDGDLFDLDADGMLSILLLATAVLFVVMAFVIRKARRE